MTSFSTRNVSRADVPAPRHQIWEAVTDPDVLAELTPLLERITVDGDRWCWKLSGIRALGVEIAPSFTVRMALDPESSMTFTPAPPEGASERAAAEGVYRLEELDDATTRLFIDITLTVDLPLPRASRRPVERIMASSMERTGDTFAQRLYARLGVDPADATRTIERRT